MEAPIEIRPAELRDSNSIRQIALATWPATYAGLISDAGIDAFLQANYSIEQIERTISAMAGGCLLASVDGRQVGYAMISRDRDGYAQLWTLYVLPELQRRGVGKALWDAVIVHARSIELDTMVVWVLAANHPARRFYELQGATFAGRKTFPVGVDEIEEVQYRLHV